MSWAGAGGEQQHPSCSVGELGSTSCSVWGSWSWAHSVFMEGDKDPCAGGSAGCHERVYKPMSRLSSGQCSQQSCLLCVSTAFLPRAPWEPSPSFPEGVQAFSTAGLLPLSSLRILLALGTQISPVDGGRTCVYDGPASSSSAGSCFPQDAPSLPDLGGAGSRWRRDTCLKQLARAGRGFLWYRLPALASHSPLCPPNRALKVLL